MVNIIKNPIKLKNFEVKDRGIPLETLKNKTIGELRKLNKDYERLIKGGKR